MSNNTVASKKEFLQSYKWHIEAFDYLSFSGLTAKERADVIKAQQILDNAINAVASRKYDNKEGK